MNLGGQSQNFPFIFFASRGGLPQAAQNVKNFAASAAAPYQALDSKYPDRVRAPCVSRRYSNSSPDFSSSRLGRASARDKSVERNNGSGKHWQP